MIPILIICVAFFAIGGSIYATKKNHNLVEEVAAEIIAKETGIDVDKLLPPDK